LENFEMKKTLVAVAALVATGAFAQVSIFGLVDLAYVKGAGAGTLTSQWAPSHIGFKGSEDLGNGMKANFLISTTAPTETGGMGGVWESFVGLSGGFGDIKAGQFFDPSFMHNATYTLTAQTGFGSSNVGLVNQAVALTPRQIQYTLPAVVSGLSVVASQSLGKAAVAADATKYTAAVAEAADNTDFTISYSVAGFSAGYADNTDTLDSGTKTKNTGVGASYDFGMAKVAYNQTTSKVGTAKAGTGDAMGISVPFGAATFVYESSNAKTSAGVKSTGSLIQVKYDISKRTFALIQYATAKTTTEVKTTGIGLVHTF
jgi:predicted porin